MYSYGPPHMAVQKQDDQHEHTFSNYVRIQDVVLKTYLGRWTIGRSGERGSGISVLPARHDDDDDDIYIFICFLTDTIFVLCQCFKYHLIWSLQPLNTNSSSKTRSYNLNNHHSIFWRKSFKLNYKHLYLIIENKYLISVVRPRGLSRYVY